MKKYILTSIAGVLIVAILYAVMYLVSQDMMEEVDSHGGLKSVVERVWYGKP